MTNSCNHKYANNGLVKLMSTPLYQIECLVCSQILYVNEDVFRRTPLYSCNNYGKQHKIELPKTKPTWCSICGEIK